MTEEAEAKLAQALVGLKFVEDAERARYVVRYVAQWLERSDAPPEAEPTVRGDLPKDVEAALEYVRQHLHHASNYSEHARDVALRYVRWVLKPVQNGASLVECGAGHKLWRLWSPGSKCPACVEPEEG